MIGLEFDEWHEVECWIEDNICNEFIDDDVNMIYRLLFMFDDGLIEDSGKLVIYEPDEIGNTTPEAVASHYGKSAR